jgi:hypothetical protein
LVYETTEEEEEEEEEEEFLKMVVMMKIAILRFLISITALNGFSGHVMYATFYTINDIPVTLQ